MPDPVGAHTSTCSPAAIGGQPCVWAGVGVPSAPSNQRRAWVEKPASASTVAVDIAAAPYDDSLAQRRSNESSAPAVTTMAAVSVTRAAVSSAPATAGRSRAPSSAHSAAAASATAATIMDGSGKVAQTSSGHRPDGDVLGAARAHGEPREDQHSEPARERPRAGGNAEGPGNDTEDDREDVERRIDRR